MKAYTIKWSKCGKESAAYHIDYGTFQQARRKVVEFMDLSRNDTTNIAPRGLGYQHSVDAGDYRYWMDKINI